MQPFLLLLNHIYHRNICCERLTELLPQNICLPRKKKKEREERRIKAKFCDQEIVPKAKWRKGRRKIRGNHTDYLVVCQKVEIQHSVYAPWISGSCSQMNRVWFRNVVMFYWQDSCFSSDCSSRNVQEKLNRICKTGWFRNCKKQ